MKNKLLVMICICVLAVFMLGSCGGSSESSGSGDSETASTEMMGESVDIISSDQGALKFVGFFKADPELTDQDNDYIFVFDFTNYKDDPEICANTFVIQFFQNGSELQLDTYTMKFEPEDQYNLIQAEYNTALKDGTVQFGHIVVPKDDSAVTIMVSENEDRDHYETIEVNLKDGTVAGGSTADSGSDSSSSANSAEQLSIGETAQTDTVEMTLDSFLFGKKVSLDSVDAENVYHMPTEETKGLSAGDGNTYFIFDFTVKNIAKESITGGDICGMDSKNHASLWTLDYNDGYTFDNGDYADLNLVFGGNYNYNPIMDPLSTSHFRGIIKCNEEVETNDSAPLILHVVLPTSNGTQNFDFKVR